MKKVLSILLISFILLSIVSCNEPSIPTFNNHSTTHNNISGNSKNEPKPKYYTISFETNGGNQLKTETVEKGFTLTACSTPSKNEHVFDGWFKDIGLTQAVILPLTIDSDITLYAKWLRISNTSTYKGGEIKAWKDSYNLISYYITPNGFEMDKLCENDYNMEITISYKVYYTKDYNAPFDIGYAGAPKYEMEVKDVNSNRYFYSERNITTSTSNTPYTISFRQSISDLKQAQLTLSFSTDNIQNTIYIDDVVVTYRCYK